MMKYKTCKECPKYQECVKWADLRSKRMRCEFALHPKKRKTKKGGAE